MQYFNKGDLRKQFVSGRRPIEKSGRSVGKKKIFQKKNFFNFFFSGILLFKCIFRNHQILMILTNLFKDSSMVIYGSLEVTSRKEERKLGAIKKLLSGQRGYGGQRFCYISLRLFRVRGGILRNYYVTVDTTFRNLKNIFQAFWCIIKS